MDYDLYKYVVVRGPDKKEEFKDEVEIRKMNRLPGFRNIDWADTFLDVADIMGKKSHCMSKKVAAVIVDSGRIISTGINGTPTGFSNCDEIFESSDTEYLEAWNHHYFSSNFEIHAEINSIISAAKSGISINRASMYVNYSPCTDCAKAIANSGISNIFFKQVYERDILGLLILAYSQADVYQMIPIDFVDVDQNIAEMTKKLNSLIQILKTKKICLK